MHLKEKIRKLNTVFYALGASSSHNNDPALKKLFIWCSYFN